MEAIVLVGGLGSRLRDELRDVPKPLAPVRNRPFLEHLLSYWIGQGVSSFILATGHGADAIREHFGPSWSGAKITYSRESAPLGTGGAFLNSLRAVREDEPLLLLNGDTWADLDARRLLEFHAQRQARLTFVAVQMPDTSRYGSLTHDQDSRVTGIQRGVGGPGLICAGAWLFDPSFVSVLSRMECEKLDLERELLAPLVQDDRFYAFRHAGAFIDIGTPEDFLRATAIIPDSRSELR
jgi:D-glycero-alpha-D-manno-heptose 1-phosphate guanylyltransferase